jgi:hypothetical protein
MTEMLQRSQRAEVLTDSASASVRPVSESPVCSCRSRTGFVAVRTEALGPFVPDGRADYGERRDPLTNEE